MLIDMLKVIAIVVILVVCALGTWFGSMFEVKPRKVQPGADDNQQPIH